MRGMMLIGLFAVAGCAINEGKNPNYQTTGESLYDEYRQKREVALLSGKQPPRIVPVALPVDAPTAAEITGPAPEEKVVAARVIVGAKAVPQTDLPVTSSGPYAGSTPVLVKYAFAASHAPGTEIWRRSSGSEGKAARACASYPSADRAQVAFLAAGGPEADPRGLDPDGDGFVCGWNPVPYRVSQL